ncbi:MAG: autotransporter domain-containing protein, partial [Phycisphaerales bacterium]|nr:autotransporter domain-containing protein [Phycisphaerales bacterium]
GEVKAGAFEYTLYRGGVGKDAASNDWYLRSGSGVRVEVPADMAVSALAPRIGRSMVGTFFGRVGSYYGPDMVRDYENAPQPDAQPDTQPSTQPGDQASGSQYAGLLWGRVFGETSCGGGGGGGGSNFGFGRNGPAYSFNYGGTQIGCDLFRSERETLGLYLGGSTLQSRVKDSGGSFAGRVTMDALSLGGYWTHYDPCGWYTDLVLQGDWYESIRSRSSSGEDFSTNGLSLTMSVETGYAIKLGKDWGGSDERVEGGLSVIPQVQFVYQYTNIQDGADHFGRIHYGETSAFYGRLGNRLSKTWSMTGLTAWAETNLWHQFDSTAKTTFSALDGSNPTTISSRLGGTWAQAVLGISVPLTRNVCVFGTADYNIGLDQSSHSFGGQLGIRVGW